MRTIMARRLLQFTTDELWEMMDGPFKLVFDDGEIETNAKETLYSTFAWAFHKEYPNTPLLMKHHVRKVLGSDRLSSDTHLTLLGNCMWSVYDTYKNTVPAEIDLRDKLAERIYQLTNLMYNELTYKLEEYVVSLDILDFLEVLDNPEIKRANETVEPTAVSISKTYSHIKHALLSDPTLKKNALSLAMRSRIVNSEQVMQCVGPRGFLTDTDSNQFPKPILTSYAAGIRSFHDSLIESRFAALSLMFSKTPLQQAEYFSRRLQLMNQIVQNLHIGDCGTTKYLLWTVHKPVVENGVVKQASNLKQIEGKYYMDDDGVLKVVHGDDVSLYGRTLKLREVIHCCHPDPYGICSTCFGELSLSVPAGTNIGQMACTSLAQKASQNVMSTKHVVGSAEIEGIVLSDHEMLYLKVAVDENSYMLSDSLVGMTTVELIIRADQAANLTDILEVDDVETLNITRLSKITEIGIRVVNGDSEHIESLDVTLNDRVSSMTYQMLDYIKRTGWNINDKGNFVIDMCDWDWRNSILTLPLKHYNMSDHSATVASMLESTVNKLHERSKVVSPDNALIELFETVNEKLNVNLAVLGVVIYGTMIISVEDNDYGLPKPWYKGGLGVMEVSMANRSLSAAMAYEGHREVLTSPLTYINNNRPDHPFDRLLVYRD